MGTGELRLRGGVVALPDFAAPLGGAVRDGQVSQQRVTAGAVPVLLTRLGPDDVAAGDDLALVPGGHDAAARRDDEQLAAVMPVPVGSGARGEDHGVDHHLRHVHDRIQVHRPGEGGGALLGRLAGPAVADVHAGYPSCSATRTPPARSPSASTTRLLIMSP